MGIALNNSTTYTMINQCCNKGNVSGIDTGGIVAWGWYITIQDCYNTGVVQGTTFTGGILGWSGKQNNCNGSIINCYNIGSVSGGTNNRTGGVLGDYGEKPEFINCYNLNTSSAYAVGMHTGVGNPWGTLTDTWPGHIVTKTQADMKKLAGTLGDNWEEDKNNINDGYPVLKWQNE